MNTYDSYISTLISHFLDYVDSSHGVIGKVETEHAINICKWECCSGNWSRLLVFIPKWAFRKKTVVDFSFKTTAMSPSSALW